MKSNRKQLRERQPYWATREVTLNPETLCTALIEGELVTVPCQGLSLPRVYSRKAYLHGVYHAVLRERLERAGAGNAAIAVLEHNRVLWAHHEDLNTGKIVQKVLSASELIKAGQVDLWFTDPPHLGRLLLHQLVEMPDYHCLMLYSTVTPVTEPVHLLGLTYIDSQERLHLYSQ